MSETGGQGVVGLLSFWQTGGAVAPQSSSPGASGGESGSAGEQGIVALQSFWQQNITVTPQSSTVVGTSGDAPQASDAATGQLLALLGATGGIGGDVSPQGAAPAGASTGSTGAEGDAGESAGAADDLRTIEGIGPKISELLVREGITTFAQLANTSEDKLDQILQDASLRMVDPSTWPQQAKLAAAGKWDELEALQNELRAGRSA